jgi:esterase/lipase superfamily enzyme
MQKYIDGWYSPSLHKQMNISVYGHYGFALLMLPTAAADFLEYERFHLIQAISPLINAGKLKVFSINSINNESCLNNLMHPRDKSIRHNQFNDYVFNEVIPYIKNKTSIETPLIATGASFGALHAMNLFLKRPDLIQGVIGMSGDYNLQSYTKGYFDQDVYFNNPMAYLPNLNDENTLSQIRKSKNIHIISGSGSYEMPQASRQLSEVLKSKNIHHELAIWGDDMPHDWPTWQRVLPFYLENRF